MYTLLNKKFKMTTAKLTVGAIYPMPRKYGVSIRLDRLISRVKNFTVQEIIQDTWYEHRLLKLYYIRKQLALIKRKEFNPDIIFSAAPLISGSLPGLYAKKVKNKPLVLDWDDSFYNFKEFTPEPWKFAYWEYKAVKQADAVIVVSKNLAETAAFIRGTKKDIYYLPNGADVKEFNPGKFNTKKLRHEFGYSPHDTVVLFIAHIGFVAGKFVGKELVDAAKEVTQNKNIRFLIVGYGKGLTLLQDYVKENSLEPYFKFTGFVNNNDMPKYISVADICIDVIWDPSKFNMQNRSSMKLKEYMAMAKPAISLRVGENITDLDNGKCGILIDYKHEALVNAIKKLATNASLRKKLGNAARKRIVTRYNLERQAKKFDSILEKYTRI